MRKVKYLVAALLLMGATTTFTSCIDNDEPAGITDLRGAKAELIRAKAAIAQARVAMVQAKVAEQELYNAAKEIQNQRDAIQLEKDKIDLAIKQATGEKEIADLNAKKAEIEARQAILAEQLKAELLAAQEATAWAEKSYQDALKAIEAAKLVMSDDEMAIMQWAQDQVEKAYTSMNNAKEDLIEAVNGLAGAIESNAPAADEVLLAVEVEKAENNLNAAQINLETAEKYLALNISTYEEWAEEVEDLKTKVAAQDTLLANLRIERAEIENSEEGRASAEALDKAGKQYADSIAIRKAAFEGTDYSKDGKTVYEGTKNKIEFAAYKLTNNAALVEESLLPAEFAYDKVVMSVKDYQEAVKNEATTPVTQLEKWIKDVTSDKPYEAELVAWLQRNLADWKKQQSAAQDDYDDAVEAWEVARDNYLNAKEYTQAEFDVSLSKVTGLLTDILGDSKYTTDEAQKLAYSEYAAYVAELKANNQIAPSKTATDYKTLYRGLVDNGIDAYVTKQYTAVTEEFLKDACVAASKIAFGDVWSSEGVNGENPRLTVPSNAEMAEITEELKKDESAAANYGALGTLLWADYQVEKAETKVNYAAELEKVAEALETQLDKVQDVIDAKTAEYQKRLTMEAGAKTTRDKAKAADDALYAEVDKKIKAAEAQKTAYGNVLQAIKTEMEDINGANGNGTAAGGQSVEEIIQSLKNNVTEAKEGVANAQKDLEKAQNALKAFQDGLYDKTYELKYWQDLLNEKQAIYDAAKAAYEKAVANLQAVVEKLSGDSTTIPDETPDTTPDETPEETPAE